MITRLPPNSEPDSSYCRIVVHLSELRANQAVENVPDNYPICMLILGFGPKTEGQSTMKKHPVISSVVLLVLFLGVLTPQFAQDTLNNPPKPDLIRRVRALGLLRTINTAEVTELYKYGSYAPWQSLLAHQSLNEWLARIYPQEANLRFGDAPEILPGLNLRLNVHTDGQGYDILLEDATDKTGYAVLTDERGVIRECKWLQ